MAKQLQEITKLRAEIDRLGDEIEWISNSPVPPDEIKARASQYLRELSQQYEAGLGLMRLANPQAGITEVRNMLVHEANVFVPGGADHSVKIAAGSIGDARSEQQVTIPGMPPTRLTVNSDGIAPIIAWYMGEAMEQRMHAEIDRLNYRAGPPLSERPALLAGLKVDLRKLEEKEEGLICCAEDEGIIIPRRVDADPAVVLGYDHKGEMAEDRLRVSRPVIGIIG